MFNFTKQKQAFPFICPVGGPPLQVVGELRLLGMLFDHELSWWPLIEDIKGRVKAKLWMLFRFRDAGANQGQLLATYLVRIRPIIEYSAQVYGACINGLKAKELEQLQAHALMIIMGCSSKSYEKNMIALGLESLGERRENLMMKFAV